MDTASMDPPSTAGADTRRYRANWQGEIDSAFVYRAMAAAEESEQLASVYVRLAEVEERHLGFWEDKLRSLGANPGARRPSWRARIMSILAIYEAKGLPRAEAEQVADRLIADEGAALDAMVREELGLDPSTLGGSPYSAAGFSFALFALGALVPLIPYFFIGGTAAVVIAIIVAAAALFVIGALITLLTGRSAVFSGTRQLVFGLLAAGVTFGLGRLIGTVVGP
jgi:hypothetical protein